MKKFFVFILIFMFIGCSSEEEIIPMEKVTDSGKNFSIEDFKKIGFKENKEYEVKELPSAISAYFGFIKNDLGEPEDYEIRFYSTHGDSVKSGTKYADNVSGENGCISKDCALWNEGLKDRIQMHDLGTLHPKYMSYLINNNIILFCPGYDEDEALLKCSSIIKKLNSE